MAVTQAQLDDFHRFASEKVINGSAGPSWQELFEEWLVLNPTPQEQAEILAAIREGLPTSRQVAIARPRR